MGAPLMTGEAEAAQLVFLIICLGLLFGGVITLILCGVLYPLLERYRHWRDRRRFRKSDRCLHGGA